MAANLRHIATEPANLSQKVLLNADNKGSTCDYAIRSRSHQMHASDSDLSVDTTSLSQESQQGKSPTTKFSGITVQPMPHQVQLLATSSSGRQSKKEAAKADWEILEGLREGQRCEERPRKNEGYLHKRRKWPMKGWHKRYFVLESGSLRYAKSTSDMTKGKLHGTVDVGLSVISTKSGHLRIDIDADEFIYHLKAKSLESFSDWVSHLRHHRLFRQHEIAYGHADSKAKSPTDEAPIQISPELAATQEGVLHLENLVEQLDAFSDSDYVVASAAPNVKRERKRFTLKGKKNKGTSASDISSLKSHVLDIPSGLDANARNTYSSCLNIEKMTVLSSSHPNLLSTQSEHCSPSLSGSSNFFDHKSQEKKIRDEFLLSAKLIQVNLQKMTETIQNERERLKQALELENLNVNSQNSAVANGLRTTLTQALQQNAELRSRLTKIHNVSELSDGSRSPEQAPVVHHSSVSYESSSVSVSEYFDAAEYLKNTDSSSEVSLSDDDEEGSFTSDNSETGTEYTPAPSVNNGQEGQLRTTGRRTKLPVPKPEMGDFNLWNLLCRNIGKDLSKVSMPVTLNEPLNTLQRLCEELEYSDLLDKASEMDDPHERMVLVAAFAVSAYGSSYYRAGHKPFNPLLGETYECIREDKGFCFVAEQVSHHPPVSACHAYSDNFTFWQDIRIKTTFWGKSMEVQPIGSVHLVLPKYNDHYRWNKVTSCVHNLFGGQRWVDQYGEMCITCGNLKCKLTFAKATYWSNKRHEVYGNISSAGKVVHSLFGKWNEALYCGVPPSARCIWRIGAMPEDHERYYGFTRFATELNEHNLEMANDLPPTDTRFRPDQRLLENGNIQGAETTKVNLEQAQRDRKKQREEESISYAPLWFRKGNTNDEKECWEFTGQYWATRKSPGFMKMDFPLKLW